MPVEDSTTQACSFASVPSPESPASSDRSEPARFLHPSQASTFSSLWCALETNLSHKEAFCRHDSAYLHEPVLQGLHKSFGNLWTTARLSVLVPVGEALNITKFLHPHDHTRTFQRSSSSVISEFNARPLVHRRRGDCLPGQPTIYIRMNNTTAEDAPSRRHSSFGLPCSLQPSQVCETCSREHTASTHTQRME